MFGWRKKPESQLTTSPSLKVPSAEAPPEKDGPIIAALLLSDDTLDLPAIQQAAAGSAFAGHRPSGLRINSGILSMTLAGEITCIAPMPAPYPWSDLEGPCATSWMWPKHTPATTMKNHRTHALVTMISGDSSRAQRRLLLLQLTALAARQPNVMGVYWPDATLVHFPKVFIDMAEKFTTPEKLPLYLIVDFRIFRNRDGSTAMFTTGLRALGLMELEIPKTTMPPAELREWAMNIAYYVLQRGAPIPDGDTLGISAEQQIRVRHVPSLYKRPGLVMRMEE